MPGAGLLLKKPFVLAASVDVYSETNITNKNDAPSIVTLVIDTNNLRAIENANDSQVSPPKLGICYAQ